MNVSKAPFGSIDGVEVDLYTLENDNGVVAKITNYGGIVTSLVVPDSQGGSADIVCGFDTLDGYFADAYKANSPYFGCIVGRYAGRIKDAKFTVDGVEYQVAANDGTNHIHGGIKGFDKCVWDAEVVDDSLTLMLSSPDGDEGYPGKVDVTVVYSLTNDNELAISYSATTDKATPLSLTNHTYFNLGGFQDKILNHKAMIVSDKLLTVDETNVQLGEEFPVAGTVWDYNASKPFGDVFEEKAMGFETYYIFSKPVGSFEKVAAFSDEASGRSLEVFSSEPSMLMYTGFYTSDELKRESGAQFGQFRAFCCETSKYPNGPNIAGAPDSVLEAGASYSSKTVFKLSW
ncbi:aldose epimerase family protein [Pontiella sulfatireligans]|uniref:Aldose 1-epimerase n=1 Tax=Pontiella sulfatireligans TaxID=2750658 RepID=A0A6C2UX96_9BACT|nr:aldose epimerase family protein [Pontiella sulfatireligans]VGO23476.1 Aldose 1-epimerase [Pontiella sulfatireligans]